MHTRAPKACVSLALLGAQAATSSGTHPTMRGKKTCSRSVKWRCRKEADIGSPLLAARFFLKQAQRREAEGFA